jgi:DNA-binding CsgD family transcriptional regulator
VLDLLLLGRSLGEIATALQITPRTAKFHQANLLEKLGADSRFDLLRLFII